MTIGLGGVGREYVLSQADFGFDPAIAYDSISSIEATAFTEVSGVCVQRPTLFEQRETFRTAVASHLKERAKYWRTIFPHGSEFSAPTELAELLDPANHPGQVTDTSSSDERDAIENHVIENSIPQWPAVSEMVYALTGSLENPTEFIAGKMDEVSRKLACGDIDDSSVQEMTEVLLLDQLAQLTLKASYGDETAEIGGKTVSLRNVLWQWAELPANQKDVTGFYLGYENVVKAVQLANVIDSNFKGIDALVRAFGDNAPTTFIELKLKYQEARSAIDHWQVDRAMAIVSGEIPELAWKADGTLALMELNREEKELKQASLYAGLALTTAITIATAEAIPAGPFYFLVTRGLLTARTAQVLWSLSTLGLTYGLFEAANQLSPNPQPKDAVDYTLDFVTIVLLVGAIRGPAFLKNILRSEKSLVPFGKVAASGVGLEKLGLLYGVFTGIDALRYGIKEGDPLKALQLDALIKRGIVIGVATMTSMAMEPFRKFVYQATFNKIFYEPAMAQARLFEDLLAKSDAYRRGVISGPKVAQQLLKEWNTFWEGHRQFVTDVSRSLSRSVPDGYLAQVSEWQAMSARLLKQTDALADSAGRADLALPFAGADQVLFDGVGAGFAKALAPMEVDTPLLPGVISGNGGNVPDFPYQFGADFGGGIAWPLATLTGDGLLAAGRSGPTGGKVVQGWMDRNSGTIKGITDQLKPDGNGAIPATQLHDLTRALLDRVPITDDVRLQFARTGVDPLVPLFGDIGAQLVFNTFVPEGATVVGNRTTVRVYAPDVKAIHVVVRNGKTVELRRDMHGNFTGVISATAGADYMLLVTTNGNQTKLTIPDPMSRQQSDPDGDVYSWSRIFDPSSFEWGSAHHVPRRLTDMVIYKLHPGIFTREGTFASLMEGEGWERLQQLRAMGVNTIELFPVNEFAGTANWGYDGVMPMAVDASYGTPADLQQLVRKLHEAGFSVVFDVVLNHQGPEGNWFGNLAGNRMSTVNTDWGSALELAGRDQHGNPISERQPAVRQNLSLVTALVGMYVRDFGGDGLRLDMSGYIADPAVKGWGENKGVLRVIGKEARRLNPSSVVIGEDGRIDYLGANLVKDTGMDTSWLFPYQHVLSQFLGARTYYDGRLITVSDVLKIMQTGVFLANGADMSPGVVFLASHDEVGNHGGVRFSRLMPPDKYRMGLGILFTSRGTPMIFSGDEYGSTRPFPFFRDLRGQLNPDQKADGLQKFAAAKLEGPDELTEQQRQTMQLTADLSKLRESHPSLRSEDPNSVQPMWVHDELGVLTLARKAGDDMLVVTINPSDRDYSGNPAIGGDWEVVINTQDPKYGGSFPIGATTPGHFGAPPRSVVIFRKKTP